MYLIEYNARQQKGAGERRLAVRATCAAIAALTSRAGSLLRQLLARAGVVRALLVLALFGLIAPAVQAQELLVAAASSLSGAMRELGAGFERVHPGTKLLFTFAASDVLVRQIAAGAPVDVFAAADAHAMDAAQAQDVIDTATRADFASNKLVAVVPKEAAPLARASDMQQPRIKRIALGQPDSVPAGRYAQAALEEQQLWVALKPKFVYALNVRQALDYVARGEADAGLVYRTDALALRDKVTVAFELATPQPIVYPIAAVRASERARLARAFIGYVRSAVGRRILAAHGFGVP
jgi:molybdate transport system substrate-binding protein